LGEKYFCMSTDTDTILQVCTNPGVELRRGRTNAVGIYTITRMTFASNYLAMGYCEVITKNEYRKVFNKTIESLSKVVND